MRWARALAPLFLVGCFDFEEPDLPQAGDPATLQAFVHLDDTGRLDFSGVLVPGLTTAGQPREVPNDTVRLYGLAVAPSEVKPDRTRIYAFTAQLAGADPTAQPLTLIAPRVTGVQADPPVLQWPGVRRLDPDSMVVPAGAEVTLRVALTPVTASPEPTSRQWNVDLSSTEGNFRLGANAVPPTEIRIPPQWIPAAANGRVTAFLTYFQTGAFRPPPGDYVLTVSADIRVRWQLRIQTTTTP